MLLAPAPVLWVLPDRFWAIPGFSRTEYPSISMGKCRKSDGFRRRSGLYKIDNFWAFVWGSFPPFRPSQKPETLRKSKQALEMAAEGADFTKSTTFGLLWGSPHFGGPKCRKCRKRKQTLEMASGKGAGSPQNRQVLGFCGVPPAFRLPPDAGNPGNFEESLEMAPAKRSRLDKINNFWAFVGSPSGIQRGLGNGFRNRIDNFWAFVVFLSPISAIPEARNP